MTMLHLNMTLFWYPNYSQGPTMSARRRRQEAQASVGTRPDRPEKCEIFFPLRGGANYLLLMGSFHLGGLFCYVFLLLGVFFAVWGPFCYFLLFWAPFLENNFEGLAVYYYYKY